MNKNFVAILGGSSILLLTMCSSVAIGQEDIKSSPTPTADLFVSQTVINQFDKKFVEQRKIDTQIETMKKIKIQEELAENSKLMGDAILDLENYIGKTRYVFAGSSTYGWDCSGLVRWFYAKFDIDLYHSATAQMLSGVPVFEPKPGDIVVFQYLNSPKAYHVGIYISEDKMIHAGGKDGDVTEKRSISKFGGDYSLVSYVRLIETN